ncbi:T9SS type A sorting domain-containing protein [Larkinella soli]|uniref:T9SS type A sorting domain-containing protein n=1 Tax=Larkinella soli TaxID=1770527 RepID=UPI0013E324B4|nr:T9SS type A sorting domain-containing protein [Larkinella soli]
MKTLLASALIALTLGTSSSSFAGDNKETAETKSTFRSVIYPVKNTMKVSVNVSKPKDSRVVIRVMDLNGQTMAVQRLPKSDEVNSVKFDLQHLEDGVYKVEVSDGHTKEVKTVKVQTSTPQVETTRLVSMN